MFCRFRNHTLLRVPARYLFDQILTFLEALPELIQGFRFRKTPAHPNHGDRLMKRSVLGFILETFHCAARLGELSFSSESIFRIDLASSRYLIDCAIA